MSLQITEWPDFLKGPSSGKRPEESAMTIGVFDGLHLGHRRLIEMVVSRGPNPTVLTFRENPRRLLSAQGGYEGDIFSLKQKLSAFESLGVKRAVLIDFSEEFSTLKGGEFLDLLQERGRMVFLAIGAAFRCGYKQDTDAQAIRARNERKGIPTELLSQVLAPAAFGSQPLSSSRVRSAIAEGDLALASALMGRSVELDVSDIGAQCGDDRVYDLRSVHRIAPQSGRYAVRLHPGAVDSWADTENGKIVLPMTRNEEIQSIEFRSVNIWH